MAHEKLNMEAAKRRDETAEDTERAQRVDRPREQCWRCDKKRHAPRRSRYRLSRAFRNICAHCAQWRVLNAEEQRARGCEPFVPAHKRPKQGDALETGRAGVDLPRRPQKRGRAASRRADETRDPYEAYEPPEITPVDDEAYAVDPNKDPLRDYTYWVQHEQALKKEKP
jgi:hypothetical protein